MKITKVSYGKTYSLGNYCSERIDLECSISEDEPPEMICAALKIRCDEIHKQNNPQLYQEQTPYPEILSTVRYNTEEEFSQQPQTQEEKITQLIQQATSLPELEQWKLLSNNPKYPQLKELYQQKLKKLKNA